MFSKLGFENRADADLNKARELVLYGTAAATSHSPPSPSGSSSVHWQKIGTLPTNKLDISCLALNSTSTLLATAGRHRQIHLWEMPARQLVKTFNGVDVTTALCFTPNSLFFYTCHANNEIYRWDLKKELSYLVTCRKTRHSRRVTSLALSPDGKILLSGSEDKTVKLWQLDFGNNVEPMTLQGYGSGIADIAISADNQWFVTVGMEKNVRIRDLHSGKLIRSINNQSGALTVAIAPDGHCLAVGSLDHKIRLWNPKNGEKIGDLLGHIDSLSALQFTHDGKFLISGGLDASLKVWDVGHLRWLKTLSAHNQPISGIVMSADGGFFVSCSKGDLPIFWKK
jgi:WD40 repeat protein